MSEFRSKNTYDYATYVVPLAAMALLLAGCSTGKDSVGPSLTKSAVSATKPAGVVEVRSDLSPLIGSATMCPNGGPRPCATLFYHQPARQTGGYANAYELPAGAKWPLEGKHEVTIVCQVEGEPISGADGKASTIWDVARIPVPADPVHRNDFVNKETLQLAQAAAPGFGVEKTAAGRVMAIYQYGADKLLGDTGVFTNLAVCTPAENPGGFQPVT